MCVCVCVCIICGNVRDLKLAVLLVWFFFFLISCVEGGQFLSQLGD